MEYKQKIANVNYFDNVVTILLERDKWNSVGTWVESMIHRETERVSKEWFEDLYWLVMIEISKEINFSNKNYEYNINIPFDIPRELLRMFVYSIGRIAYSFDVKPLTAIRAQNILQSVNRQLIEQLPVEDKWFKYNY